MSWEERVLRSAKSAVLRTARTAGLFARARESDWRRNRLLILCYHGISFEDEHLWKRSAYHDVHLFRSRLAMLRDGSFNVLRLEEAVQLLEARRLPPRSAVLTFDDGLYNFHALAYPVLREFGFPVTLYVSTYYCRHQLPVFDYAASYVLWKACGKTIDGAGLVPEAGALSLSDPQQAFLRIRQYAADRELTAAGKDQLVETIAERAGIDYGSIRRNRMLHLMTADEVAAASAQGVDIQLHTHRHRTPRDRALFTREIEDNRRELREITGKEPAHFCYPCGDFTPEYFGWLRELGVRTAVTGECGMASPQDDLMRLPRLLDGSQVTAVDFESWLTGFTPRVRQSMAKVGTR